MDTPDTATGTITFTDLDLSDTHDVTITGVVASGTMTGLASGAASWLTLGALHDLTTGVTGSDVWSFSAADHYFDYLAEGEHVTLTYTVQVDDHHGGVVTQPVTITINGSNDAPVAHADSDTGHIVEAGNDLNDNIIPGVATTPATCSQRYRPRSQRHPSTSSAWSGEPHRRACGRRRHFRQRHLRLADAQQQRHLDLHARQCEVGDQFPRAGRARHRRVQLHRCRQPRWYSTTTLTIGITGTNDAPVGTNNDPFAVTDTNTGAPVVEKGVNPGNTPFNGNTPGNVLPNDFDIDTGDTKTVQGVASGTPTGLQTDHVGSASPAPMAA